MKIFNGLFKNYFKNLFYEITISTVYCFCKIYTDECIKCLEYQLKIHVFIQKNKDVSNNTHVN